MHPIDTVKLKPAKSAFFVWCATDSLWKDQRRFSKIDRSVPAAVQKCMFTNTKKEPSGSVAQDIQIAENMQQSVRRN